MGYKYRRNYTLENWKKLLSWKKKNYFISLKYEILFVDVDTVKNYYIDMLLEEDTENLYLDDYIFIDEFYLKAGIHVLHKIYLIVIAKESN